jgi:cytochrome c553
MKQSICISAILSLMSTSISHAAGDAAKGKVLSSACASCHGSYGVSVDDQYPNLAGQHQSYLINALQEYQSGQRNNMTMKAEIGPLSAQDIENLAAYYSANILVPSYSEDSKTLHIPYAEVGSERYQAEFKYLNDFSFEMIKLEPLD